MLRKITLAAALALSGQAQAESLRVVVDIPPLYGLVASVMGDTGAPELLMKAGSSPHGHALRPSEAARLQLADLLVWMGPEAAPWLDEALEKMAPEAISVALPSTSGTMRLMKRAADHHEEHEDEGHDHGYGPTDPHLWLNPDNASLWLDPIAEALAAARPEHVKTYRTNATAAKAALATQTAKISARLAPFQSRTFLTDHDAFQYFEARFGLTSLAGLTDAEGHAAGPAHLQELFATEADPACLVTGLNANDAMVSLVQDELELAHVTIDPLGANLPLDAAHYPALLESLTAGFEACFSGN